MSNKNEKIQDYFNILLIGDPNVGKTSILERYCNNRFLTYKYNNTLSQIYKKFINQNTLYIGLKFWDINFNEKFFKLYKTIYERTDIIIFICSFDNRKSLDNINIWYQNLLNNIDLSSKLMVLFANKNDLDKKEFNSDNLIFKADSLKLKCFEMSAKNNINIQESFDKLINDILINNVLFKIKNNIRLKINKDNDNNKGNNCVN
jgi:small GTP-binding protein